ncbi:pentapeptide repeat-containing protein [Dactylosporangium sp. NPDC000555]|uniref:pentapeptide repeat-containing protein n=1 Tax=Dactylosporangium sp. NPDC000555 TaxID=3154260 RepID=UPI0033191D76
MPAPRTVGAIYLVTLAIVAAVLSWHRGDGADHGHRCAAAGSADLNGRTVTALDLDGRPMRCTNLERSTVDGPVGAANLSGSNLHRATLRDAAMTDVDLTAADLTLAVARSAEFTGVKLVRADLGGADLRESTLTDVGLEHARLRDANLHGVSFVRADLKDADVRGADLTNATLTDSNLRGARLDGANLSGTSWVNVVCPDGVKSTGGSCDGHLRPR